MTTNKILISKAKKFYENKNFFEAKTHLIRALKKNQIDKTLKISLYILISDVCYKINEFKNAEKYLLESIKLGKSSAEIFNSLGNIYLKKRDYKNSENSYLKSINIEKKNEIALVNLAILYHNLGRQKEAITFYKKVLEVNPQNVGALYNLSKIDQAIINKKTIEILKNQITEKNLNNFNLASSYFLLADVEKNKKNFNEEIKLLAEANRYSFKSNEKKNYLFNEYWLHGISKKFNKIEYTNNKNISFDNKNVYPIFIMGLPRCGSTLIESIISSGNENVENLGETNLVNWAFLNSNNNFLTTLKKENTATINLGETSNKLMNAIKNLNINSNNKKVFFSEKSLENFYYIELILNIYPNARFLHPHRNLIDNVIAIYKQFLPSISWSHSIEDILIYIDNYLSVLDYYKKKYSDRILSVSLEDFSTNPKNLSKQIYNFCSLEWNDNCLEFYKRKDLFINTASNNQMRTSVKKYDDNKYIPYKEIVNKYLHKYSWLNY